MTVKSSRIALILVASVKNEHRHGLRRRASGPVLDSGMASAAPFPMARESRALCSSDDPDIEDRGHGEAEVVSSEIDAGDALSSRPCFPPCRLPACAPRRLPSRVSRIVTSSSCLSACPDPAAATLCGDTDLERSSSSREPEGRLFIGWGLRGRSKQ